MKKSDMCPNCHGESKYPVLVVFSGEFGPASKNAAIKAIREASKGAMYPSSIMDFEVAKELVEKGDVWYLPTILLWKSCGS